MDDFEERLEKRRAIENFENEAFFKKVADTIKDGKLIYKMLCECVRKRFSLDKYAPAYLLVDAYFDEDIEIDFEKWLYCDDAPLIIRLDKFEELFYELKPFCRSEYDIVDIVNKVYNLDFEICNDYDCCEIYVYTYSINFNNFKHINKDKAFEIRKEIEFCKKYNINDEKLVKELQDSLGNISVEDFMEV